MPCTLLFYQIEPFINEASLILPLALLEIHRISKIIFALGADEFLAMLEGKIRDAPFF